MYLHRAANDSSRPRWVSQARAVALASCALSLTVTGVYAHSPTPDADVSDWCLDTAPRVEDSAAVLTCPIGTETVWWDAPADAAVNDLAFVATTRDAAHLYVVFSLHNDVDPLILPFVEFAIDVGPGGNNLWSDPQGRLVTPGHCNADTSRLCTEDEDCHFCAISTAYTGTPEERPRTCGSTDAQDLCEWLNPADVCIRDQSCENLDSASPVPSVGALSSPVGAPDYLLVYDLGRWLIGLCDAVKLMRNDNGAWVEIPRPVPDSICPLPTWHFSIIIPPGIPELEHDDIELAVPWGAFDCEGCVPFGPEDEFRWSLEINRGALTLDYTPFGAIEDVMSEAVGGTTTTTPNSCDEPGTATTLCEIADGSADAFVPLTSRAPGGRVSGLLLQRNDSGSSTPSITLTWDPSCSIADTDYEVYEGRIGDWYGHAGPASGAICSTGGATTATFETGADNHYYLVVPRDAVVEGSYGQDGNGQERPSSTTPCAGQSLGDCAALPLAAE